MLTKAVEMAQSLEAAEQQAPHLHATRIGDDRVRRRTYGREIGSLQGRHLQFGKRKKPSRNHATGVVQWDIRTRGVSLEKMYATTGF